MASVIPSNKLQQRLGVMRQDIMSPSSGVRHTATGILIDVYDGEKLPLVALSPELENKIKESPGLLFAKIRLLNDKDYILPFQETADQIFSTYGNHTLLEGRPAKVEYGGVNIETGYIYLQRTFVEPILNLGEVSKVLDIGNII